jgi:hypothetical protein
VTGGVDDTGLVKRSNCTVTNIQGGVNTEEYSNGFNESMPDTTVEEAQAVRLLRPRISPRKGGPGSS